MTRIAPPLLAALALVACVLLLGVARPGQAAQNPFLNHGDTGGADQSQQDQGPQLTGYPGFLAPVMERIAWLQVALKHKLVAFSRDIKENPMGRAFWLFLGTAFAYGVLHAVGPGHGKLYACSYFLSRPSTLMKGLMLGNLSMFAHVLSATTLVLGGYYVLRMAGAMAVENMTPILETVSYSLLVLVGLYLTVRTVLDLRSGRVAAMVAASVDTDRGDGTDDSAPPPPPRHGHHHGPRNGRDLADTRSLWSTALAVGLVPCPGAAIILIFAVSQHLLLAGILAMLAISLGMGMTITLVAAVAILFHRTVFALARERCTLFVVLHALLSFTGSLAILALGSLLLMGRLL